MYRQACPSCSRQHFCSTPFLHLMAEILMEAKMMNHRRGKKYSLGNAVCYRKDNPVGTQFLTSPCVSSTEHHCLHKTETVAEQTETQVIPHPG